MPCWVYRRYEIHRQSIQTEVVEIYSIHILKSKWIEIERMDVWFVYSMTTTEKKLNLMTQIVISGCCEVSGVFIAIWWMMDRWMAQGI